MTQHEVDALHEQALTQRYDELALRVHGDVSEMHEIKLLLGWV